MAPDVKGGVDKARADIFRKGKKELDHLPPTSDALQLHAMRANYQSKVWLYADKQCIKSFAGSPVSSGGRLSMGIILAVAWSTLPAVPKVCLELVACGCLTKCKSSACECSNTHQICTRACGCNAENCCNPTSWVVVYYHGPNCFGDGYFSILF